MVAHCIKWEGGVREREREVCVCVCVCVCARACATLPAKVKLRYSNLTHHELKCYLIQAWLHFVRPLTHLPLLCEYF